MAAGRALDHLGVDPDPVGGAADAPFQHVAHAELAAHLADVGRLALVGEGRIAGDDEEAGHLGEIGDDVLGDAVGEVALLRIAGHVVEGKHRDRRSLRERRLGRRHDAFRILAGPPPPDVKRAVDVLHRVLAAVDEGDVYVTADMLTDGVGDRDAARLGQALDAGRNVDAVAEDVLAFDDDVADMDADPVLQRLVLRDAVDPIGHRRLHGDAALDGVDGRGELDQKAIARRLDDAAPMLRDRGIDDLGARGLEARERATLAMAHEPRISDDIGGHDRGEPALFPRHLRLSFLHPARGGS